MTNKNYYTNKNYDTKNTPSNEDFHHFASNILSECDFCTNYNSGIQIDKVVQSLRWTYANDKGRSKKRSY